MPGLSGPRTAGDEDPHQATTTRGAPADSGAGLRVCGMVVVITALEGPITGVPG